MMCHTTLTHNPFIDISVYELQGGMLEVTII